jgi:hypothetical protein
MMLWPLSIDGAAGEIAFLRDVGPMVTDIGAQTVARGVPVLLSVTTTE